MTILPAPPPDWKRPAIPARVKLQVLLNQDGRCKATGERLGLIDNVEFDHRPALWERRFDTETGDTIPPANDPAGIEAIAKAPHKHRTKVDAGRRAKVNRITGKKAARFSGPARGIDVGAEPTREAREPRKTIQSRGFDKSRRKKMDGTVEVRT